jgi:hypothetical protein
MLIIVVSFLAHLQRSDLAGPLRHYADLKPLLDKYGDRLADHIDSGNAEIFSSALSRSQTGTGQPRGPRQDPPT